MKYNRRLHNESSKNNRVATLSLHCLHSIRLSNTNHRKFIMDHNLYDILKGLIYLLTKDELSDKEKYDLSIIQREILNTL